LLRSLTLSAACLAASAQAAGYVWLERTGTSTAHARYTDTNIDAPATKLPALDNTSAFLADGKPLTLTPSADRLTVSVPGPGDLRFVGKYADKDGTLVIYEARAGRSDTKAINDLELVPTASGGNTFKLVWKGQEVAATQVNVSTSTGWVRTLKPSKDGTVTLPTPFAATYVMEVTAQVNGSATVDGKRYETVRHTATTSFTVGRPAEAAGAASGVRTPAPTVAPAR
jgi:hypothetical protein